MIAFSAVRFGMSPPLAKLLVADILPVALAGLLYLGAFLGHFLYSIFRSAASGNRGARERLKQRDLSWLVGAILSVGIIAPISLMFGLTHIEGFTASLLLNLEGVATAVIAVCCFREDAGKRLWIALICMTAVRVSCLGPRQREAQPCGLSAGCLGHDMLGHGQQHDKDNCACMRRDEHGKAYGRPGP